MSEKEPHKKIDIFALAGKVTDEDMEKVHEEINRITDGGQNPGALFLDPEPTIDDAVDAIDRLFGVVSVTDMQTGQKESRAAYYEKRLDKVPDSGLKGLLDAPEAVIEPKTSPGQQPGANSAILEEALRLRNDGKSVIPVGKNKIPLLHWKEFHERIATEDEIRSWWKKWPEAQLGMVTGKISDIAVVDVEKEFGDYTKLGLPETTVSRTGSGGFHLFYAYVDGVKNKAKINNQEVDVRGEGGYVIVPPSSNENGEYKWLKEVDELPAFPVNIIPPEIPVAPGEKRESTLDYEVLNYPGFGHGQRNNEMTKYAGALLARMTMDLWDDVAWPIFERANEKNDPPLPQQELEATWRSICSKEETQSLERWQERNREKEKDERRKMLDDIENDDIVTIDEAAEEVRKIDVETVPTGFAEFDNAMRGGFKEGDLIILTGISGQGKTTLGQTFTYNLTENNVPVLWFSYEVPVDALDERFGFMNMKNKSKIYVPKKVASGEIMWVKKKISEAKEKFGVKTVIIDLIDFLEPINKKLGDNETLTLKRITTELKTLAREERLILFVMAHVRKQQDRKKAIDLQDVAYSSAIYQLADYVIVIDRQGKEDEPEEFKEAISAAGGKAKKRMVYNNQSEIRFLKNRSTGQLISILVDFGMDERFHPVTSAESVKRNMDWTQK